ncbi:ParB/RepB/Spo0J family partition protein [Tautonia plasticadhaerens]|uniref:ParB-like nuclease domain protein n=1 Tax=Tautonia plasticadhaerens TaxID=2527974 RepID=A0A518H2E0_9BACT|nr:ParB N-terminal domain-containing protein [Tautonia plasticadhaerens]QDV34990.1 ParB-like nuclease domain protein [Tautonia plasticadhaerens]
MLKELDPADCFPPHDNRPITDEDVADLVEDYQRNGQLQPGIVCPHPDLPGKWLVIAGGRRGHACRIARILFRAEVRDTIPSQAEIIEIRVGENSKRKNLDAFQLCNDITTYKKEKRFTTWAEAGKALGIPASTLSSITCVRRIPPELRPKTERLCGTVVRTIARMPTRADMEELIAKAFDENDQPIPKDRVELLAKQMKEGNKSGRKPRGFTVKDGGHEAVIKPKPGVSTEDIAKWLEGLAAKLKANKHLPPDGLRFLFP